MISLKEAIERDGQILHYTKGISMQPMLVEGQNAVLVGKVFRTLKKGDVILFEGNNDCVLHRIIRCKNGTYITRGDNNLFYDKPVSKDMVIGLLLGYYKGDKYIDCEKDFKYRVYSVFIPFRYHRRKLVKRIRLLVPKSVKNLIKKSLGK